MKVLKFGVFIKSKESSNLSPLAVSKMLEKFTNALEKLEFVFSEYGVPPKCAQVFTLIVTYLLHM